MDLMLKRATVQIPHDIRKSAKIHHLSLVPCASRALMLDVFLVLLLDDEIEKSEIETFLLGDGVQWTFQVVSWTSAATVVADMDACRGYRRASKAIHCLCVRRGGGTHM